jgi:hypothetical protein
VEWIRGEIDNGGEENGSGKVYGHFSTLRTKRLYSKRENH